MHTKSEEHTEHRKLKRSRRGPLPLFLVILGIGAALVLYLQLQRRDTGDGQLTLRTADTSIQKESTAPPAGDRQPGIRIEPTDAASSVDPSSFSGQPAAEEPAAGGVPEPLAGQDLAASDAAIADYSYSHSLVGIESFYQHLDQEPYLRAFQLGAPSRIYFSRLTQRMLDTPPMVSGETSDLFSILQNTAHFFRVVGQENIQVMKAVLSNEKDSYEDILAAFYLLSHRPDYLESRLDIKLRQDALYDYAGFFLSTMGGRLYLFRRDTALRMVVSYYSILIVDEANRDGRNRHGVDLRPALDNLISEMEGGGGQLKFRDQYLDRLYGLKEKYL